jgi:Flp pilus assembly protein TadG
VNERGQASVLLVGVVLLGLAFAGLAVDGTRLFTARRDLHNIADSAALAGASAIDEAQFRASDGVEVRLDPVAAHLAVDAVLRESNLPADTRVEVDVDTTTIEVRLARPVDLTFLRILGARDQTIGAHATASPNTG